MRMRRRMMILVCRSGPIRHGHYLEPPYTLIRLVDERVPAPTREDIEQQFRRTPACCLRPGLAQDIRARDLPLSGPSAAWLAAWATSITMSLSNADAHWAGSPNPRRRRRRRWRRRRRRRRRRPTPTPPTTTTTSTTTRRQRRLPPPPVLPPLLLFLLPLLHPPPSASPSDASRRSGSTRTIRGTTLARGASSTSWPRAVSSRR